MEKKGRFIGMRTFGLVIVGCLLLSFLFLMFPQAALAQEGLWSYPAPTWVMKDIHSVGLLNVSQDYSHEYLGEVLSETFTHSLYASAPEGESRILDVLSVIPTRYGSQLSSVTAISYDSLGTEGQLTVEEGTNVGFSIFDNGCLGASVGSQVALTQGIAHSSIRAESGMMHTLTDYGFSSSGKGRVEVGSEAVSISNTAHETYSQHITADGEFNIHYSADFNLRSNPLSPFGGAP
jgi:hypothetical protein